LLASLVDSLIYGLWFGLTMPYLGERLAALRAPWNWASIIALLLPSAVCSTLIAELSLRTIGLLKVEEFWPEVFFKSLGVFFIALVIAVSVYTYEQVQGRMQATKLQLHTQELEKGARTQTRHRSPASGARSPAASALFIQHAQLHFRAHCRKPGTGRANGATAGGALA